MDYNPAKKLYTPSDPSSVVAKNPLRRAKVQELISQMSPEHETQWRNDYQVWSYMKKINLYSDCVDVLYSHLTLVWAAGLSRPDFCALLSNEGQIY